MSRLSLIRTLALLLLLALGLAVQAPKGASPAPLQTEAVVLAAADDPYLPLAQEIAQGVQLPLAHTPAEALARRPAFLIWVASPAHLSDAAMVGLGRALEGQGGAVAVGLISGSTLEQARALWLRQAEVRPQPAVAVNAEHAEAGFPHGRILTPAGEEPLSLAGLQRALRGAGYLTFTGHGGTRYWRLAEGMRFLPADIPALPPIVIGTASCNTFRLWEEDSIALAFVDRGAAAYAGFSYSPNEGYLIGEFDGLPFRYTWPEFPIGCVMAVQARGTRQGFAAFPYYWLLGDPRLALQAAAPYRLVRDEVQGDRRTLVYAGAPAGVIPVRVPGGAGYTFVEAEGITAAWARDPFYNSRLQMADIGEDKYLLVEHAGGELTLRLRRRPPLGWVPLDIAADALDHTLIHLQRNGGDLMALAGGGLALIGVAWRLLRRRAPLALLLPAAIAGLTFAALHGLYSLLRLGQVTITSKPVFLSPLGIAATFLLVAAGAFLYLSSQSRRGREFAVWLAALPALLAMVFGLVVCPLNLLVFAPRLGTGLYNLALALLALGALLIELVLFELAFALLRLVWGRARTREASAAERENPLVAGDEAT